MVREKIKVHGQAIFNHRNRARFNKEEELALWGYLKEKLSGLKDGNRTAKEIFNHLTK